MKTIKVTVVTLFSLFLYIAIGHSTHALAEGSADSRYILRDVGDHSQRQKIYIYNRGRLETEILKDNSMVQYSYDRNGNILKRVKSTSSEPYVFSSSAQSYDIYLKGVSKGIQQVHFPTWTQLNGQDDVEWILGEKISEGVWKATVVLSKHGNEKGVYITHIYADGKLVADANAEVKDTMKITSPNEVSMADGPYEVKIEGVAGTISEVSFPTWSLKNGQDDLESPWISGEKIEDNTWRILIPFNKHNYDTGVYITHIYGADKYGNSSGLGGTTVNVKGGAGGSKETDLIGVSYDVFIYGIDPQIQSVQFPTWTANKGQDDLEWIQGVKIGEGAWKGTVVYTKHHSETGRYITHIYSNNTNLLGAWEYNVTNSTLVKAPTTAKVSSGSYEVSIEGVPSNVKLVEFPTWTISNGQDDIEWIQGERVSSNKWKARVSFNKHNNETGVYVTHIYAHDAYGNSLGIGGVDVNVGN